MPESPDSEQTDARCPRWLAAWAGASARRRVLVLVLAALLTGLSVWAATTRLGVSTNTVDMLSPELTFRQHAKTLNRAFPDLQDNIVAVIEAPTPERAAALADALERRLADAPALQGSYQPGGAFLERHALYYLSTNRLGLLLDRLAGAQPLLATLAERPNLGGLAETLELAAGAGPPGSGEGLAPLLDEMAAAARAHAEGRPRNLSWQALLPAPPGTPDRARRVLILQPNFDYARLKPAGPAIDAVRAAAAEVTAELGAGRVRLTGEAVVKHAELETVERSALLSGLLSLVGVAAILVLGLRSVQLVAASLITLVTGLVWTAGVAALLVGELNLISVAFAVLFVGLGVDFAIHFVLRAREAVGDDVARVTAAGAGSGCAILLAAVCAAAGFLAFWPTDYRGLAELGAISGIGMAVAAAASVTVLPALLGLFGCGPVRAGPGPVRTRARWMLRRHRPVLAGVAGLGLAACALAPWVEFDFNPMNLRDGDSEAMRLFDELATDPATTPYVVQVLADDADAADRVAGRFRADGRFGSARTLSSYVPPEQARKADMLADAAFFLGPVAAREVVPRPLAAQPRAAAWDRLTRAVDRLAARDGSLGQRARALQAALAPAGDPAAAAQALERRWTVYLPQLFERLRTGLEAAPFGRADLPAELRARWVAPDGRARVEVRPAEATRSNAEIRAFADAARAVTPRASGTPIVIDAAAEVVQSAFLSASGIAAAAMVLILAVTLRHPADVAMALAPLPLAAVLTLATAAVVGLPLNFANIIVLPLLMGLTVSSGVHFVLRWRQTGSAERALASSTPRAVLLSVLTTLAAFGSLAMAEHPGMSSMGQLLSIAVVHVVLAVLVGLPALLAVAGRRHVEAGAESGAEAG